MLERSVIGYTNTNCKKCLKCLRSCVTKAITIVEGRVRISNKKCINCGECIKSCTSLGLEARGSTIVDIKNYDYTVCLVPSALSMTQSSNENLSALFAGIKKMGFDEVRDISGYEARIYKETLRHVYKEDKKANIASFCPVVNRLVKNLYPSLYENIVPIIYPAELAAREVRAELKDQKNLGIFYLSECISKLALAKYPYGDETMSIDHALSIVDLFPIINKLKEKSSEEVNLSKLGIVASTSHLISENYKTEKVLVADTFQKICEVIDLSEFNLLNDFDLLYLFKCNNGCVGGDLLFGNPYQAKKNALLFADIHTKEATKIDDISKIYYDNDHFKLKEDQNFKERMDIFKKTNEILEKLAGFDCGACGYASCRELASDILEKKAKYQYCKVKSWEGFDENN